MFLEILIVLIVILGIIFFAGQVKRDAKKGSILSRHFRRFPRYWNRQKWTSGRISGEHGIEKQDAEHSRVRYKTGFFSYSVDENIPNWAIKERQALPNIPEGVIEVIPYLPNTQHITETEEYTIQINKQSRLLKTMESMITQIKQSLSTQGNMTVAEDQINRVAEITRQLSAKTEAMKTKTETTILETPTETKKLA